MVATSTRIEIISVGLEVVTFSGGHLQKDTKNKNSWQISQAIAQFFTFGILLRIVLDSQRGGMGTLIIYCK